MEKTNFNLLNWMKKYSKKIILFIFIVVIPLFILSILLFQFSNNNRRFYFDKENEDPIYLTSKVISKNKDLDEYFSNLDIKLKRITTITKDDVTYDDGNFLFEIDYTLNSYYEGSNVEIRWILKTNYTDVQSQTRSVSMGSDTISTNMDYLFEIPKTKYLIFKTNKPIAYFEIKITKPSSLGENKIETLYYKVDTNKSKGYEVKK